MPATGSGAESDARPVHRALVVARRVAAEAKRDHLTLMSAGVAFYALIALIPAIAAVVSIYGFVADPEEVGEHLASFLEAAPEAVGDLVLDQAQRIAESSDAAASLGAAVSIVLALWAASAGCQHLIVAVNAAYDREDQRGFVARRALAFGLTLGAIVFMAVAVAVITVVPPLLAGSALGGPMQGLLRIGRWPVLALALLLALAVLYRLAPSGDGPPWRWFSPGALIAGALWLVASGGFSIYVSNFASYNETYGSLGAVVIVMLWLFISALAVILGAEVNSEVDKLRAETAELAETSGSASARAARAVRAARHGAAESDGARAGARTTSRETRPLAGSRAERGDRAALAGGPAGGDGGGEAGGWGSVVIVAVGRAIASAFGKHR